MAKKITSKTKHWTRIIGRWCKSGQSAAAFCRVKQISQPSFYAWRRRLGAKAGAKPARRSSKSPAFLPVKVVETTEAVAEFVLGRGRLLRLRGEVSPARLAEIAHALELEC